MHPNFLVIGSAKCATTSLCELLHKHPDVFICKPKEPHFFSLDDVYQRGWSWYESLFADVKDESAVGEGSTSYTRHGMFPNTATRIARHLPEARLIYIARNPTEKAESLWMHSRNNNIPLPPTFSEAVRTVDTFIDETLYWRQLNYYRQYYPDDRILVLFYEEFKTHPDAVLEECFRFLGIDPSVKIQDTQRPSNVSHEDKILMSLLRKIPFFNKAYYSLPKRIQYRLNATLKRPATSRPAWNDETRNWFLQQIAQDMARFLEFNGKPNDYWLKEPATQDNRILAAVKGDSI